MSEFDEIESLKGEEKEKKLTDYYQNKVKVNSWITNSFKNTIINFKDRTEYKKNNQYHRINGPAIDYNNDKLDKYYYNGKLFDSKEEWEKVSIKDIRKIKIKKLNKKQDNE